MHLDYVRLLVGDFDACFRFYRDIMGFKVRWGQEGDRYGSFDMENGTALALFQRKAMAEILLTAELPANAKSQDRMLLVFGVDNTDKSVRELKKRGAKLEAEPENRPNWGIRTAYLRDPDGNLIEINSPMPRNEWSEELNEEAGRFERRE